MSSTLDAALAWHQAGVAVIRVRSDGTKAPADAWKKYQTTPPTLDEIHQWFDAPQQGLGVVCGAVSGNLEMVELEGRAVTEGFLEQVRALCVDNGLGHLWDRLVAGYSEITPSGGLHWFYRVDDQPRPNTKLARAADHLVLAETRGEGGFVVIAPSNGSTHETGKPWVALTGSPASIPTFTIDERDGLHAMFSMLDRTPAEQPVTGPDPVSLDAGGLRPGDDYNQRTSWRDILVPHGWKPVRRFGQHCIGWVRPGKTVGISATSGRNDADNLYVFTTSTQFDAEKPYSKFAAYALLEHGGDYSAAAKALRADGYGAGAEQRRPLAAVVGEGTPTGEPSAQPQLTVVEPVTYTRTDDGNALRLVDAHTDHLRFVPERGQWLAWDTRRWRWDGAGHVNELARALARDLPRDEQADRTFRRRSLSRNGLSNMIAVAQTDPRIVAPLATLDADPYALATPGGVVDLRTGTLAPPDPAALHTRSATVAPTSDTPHRWNTFLADTFAGDPDVTTYVQRLLGLSLVGTVLEQLLPFCFGEGANGKTTLLGTVQRLVGIGADGYAQSAPAELLLATKQSDHPTEIAGLSGARLVVTSELEDGQRFAEAKVKILTGRDPLSARFMRQDYFTFTPTHTLWLLANHEPSVRAGGLAFWRRLRKVPFLHTVPAESRNPHLEDQLVDEEGPAILGWLVTGARDYLAHGLTEPASVTKATADYALDQDTVGRFVNDCCETGSVHAPHLRVAMNEMRASYETWCRVEGEQPISSKALGLTLRSRFGVETERSKSSRFYLGIRLNDIEETESSDRSSDPFNRSPHPSEDDTGDDWWQR